MVLVQKGGGEGGVAGGKGWVLLGWERSSGEEGGEVKGKRYSVDLEATSRYV